MLGCYDITDHSINYIGNKIRTPLADVKAVNFAPKSSNDILTAFTSDAHFQHLHNIDNGVHDAAVNYFRSIKADWTNLPLTTKMISSPGEVYAGKKLDYTTDALPVTLKWFDDEDIFLAESSQFYLELRLLIEQAQKVYSIYNSFRKEKADFSHLAEFQHIEFEGKVSYEENIKTMLDLTRYITDYLLKHNREDLLFYLTTDEINELSSSFAAENIAQLTFSEAMKVLHTNLKDDRYKQLSLKNFGAYEEVALTRILNKHCLVTDFPLEEIPFYHDESFTAKDGKQYAKNADLILLGYRETIGSGQRITNLKAIQEKARFFGLPAGDYEPYIDMRKLDAYKTTCGFGMGWQRYTQWLLKMPFIWEMSHIPRGHVTPRP